MICIVCPKGCALEVDENGAVSGNTCPRGEEYGRAEMLDPRRTLTATVAISGALYSRCPVKSAAPLPKGKLFAAMDELRGITLTSPVAVGQPVIKNVCGTGIDIVATRNL
jgi:CxxC motif-containing protein